ncbi:MAG: pilus assembly protein PilM [Deltaproteobacteria bacterium]|nr:pilus assembly protein PilM [Deltaproteobacteria bacterium]MBW2421689.1 pilus assembly protein PilM [Deltaproteobacteria bacterium]
MMMKKVLGLDVGAHSIKAVVLRQTLRGIEAEQLRLQPRGGDDAELADLLRRFLKLHQLPAEHVVCAIAGERISTRRLDFPFRDRKKLATAVPFEVEGEIPFALEDVIVDWELVGGEGKQGRVVASITQRREISSCLDSLREAAIDPRVLVGEGLVLGNLPALFDLPGDRLLVDLGHRKTSLCLLQDGRAVGARSISVGGEAITHAIAEDRGCSLDEAERAKCEEGIAGAASTPRAVAVVDRIAREMVRTLESSETAVAAITLFGGTAKLPGIDDFLSERVGVAARCLAPPEDPERAAILSGGDPLLFAPAFALALRATAESRTRMNLRREEFAYRTDLRQFFGKDLRTTAVLAGVAALLGCATFTTSVSLESRRAKRAETETARLYSEAFPDQPQPANPVTAMSQVLRESRERADFLGVYGSNLSALDLLAELSRRVPSDLRVRFDEISIDGRIIKIKVLGESYEAADRLKTVLAQSPPFTSAKVAGEVKSQRRGKGKTFNLTISLDDLGGTS